MNKLTYRQAYDKIIEAYFKDEINPLNAKFCLCGTLCDKTDDWFGLSMLRHKPFNGYSGIEFIKMESALLIPIYTHNPACQRSGNLNFPGYEDVLFEGMCTALDVLKEIHRSRGEDVDGLEVPAFTKRQLQKA